MGLFSHNTMVTLRGTFRKVDWHTFCKVFCGQVVDRLKVGMTKMVVPCVEGGGPLTQKRAVDKDA